MEEHKHKDLRDLLKNKEINTEDAFEKDALEGFAMLESEEEILELKNSLDIKIAPVFEQKEKKKPIIFWLAAAGLILMIGFSIYFLKQETKTDLAMVDTPAKSFEESAAEFKSAESATVQADKSSIVEEKLSRSIAAEKTAYDRKALRDEEKGHPNDEAAKLKDRSENSENNLATVSDELDEVESTQPASPLITETSKKESTVNSKSEPEKESSSYASTKASGKIAADKGDSKNKTTESAKKNKSPEYAPLEKRDDANSEIAVSESVKSAPATSANENNAGPVNILGSSSNSCYYNGGPAKLQSDLKILLEKENADKAFEAMLYINEKKQVNDVKILTKGLSNKEEKKIRSVLKGLNGFTFYIQPSTKSLSEFKVIYIP